MKKALRVSVLTVSPSEDKLKHYIPTNSLDTNKPSPPISWLINGFLKNFRC
jgi:hypothetical protein